MFKTRLLTTAIILPIFIAALIFLPPLYWAILVYLIVLLAAWEWADMAHFNKAQAMLYIGVFSALILPVIFFAGSWAGLLNLAISSVAFLFWLIFVPVWLKFKFRMRNKWLLALIGLIVIAPVWFALIALDPISQLILLATVWIADIAAYLVGKRFGKHQLAPNISPGKTWEGFYGALAAVAIYACLLSWGLHMGGNFVIMLLIVAAFSVLGDLFESLIKRQAGVKDSGDLLPGHGGVLDRVDGGLAALPIVNFLQLMPLLWMLMAQHG